MNQSLQSKKRMSDSMSYDKIYAKTADLISLDSMFKHKWGNL
jgi:hypothetical protein